MNNLTITGRIATDITTKLIPAKKGGDQTIAKFRIAVPTRKKDVSEFFSVVVFGPQAEAVANFMSKGKKVAVSGRLHQNTWASKTETGANGEPKMLERVEIVAHEVEFLSPPEKKQETVTLDDEQYAAPAGDSVDTIWDGATDMSTLGF